MTEAARRMGVSRTSASRALMNAGIPLTRISEKALAVDEADIASYLKARGPLKPGRPRKTPADAAK